MLAAPTIPHARDPVHSQKAFPNLHSIFLVDVNRQFLHNSPSGGHRWEELRGLPLMATFLKDDGGVEVPMDFCYARKG